MLALGEMDLLSEALGDIETEGLIDFDSEALGEID